MYYTDTEQSLIKCLRPYSRTLTTKLSCIERCEHSYTSGHANVSIRPLVKWYAYTNIKVHSLNVKVRTTSNNVNVVVPNHYANLTVL